ncbi:hypothetical protein D9758_010296 [Tetrapyrgos nigripes]|uniref:Zn(2)-C6 fungal-type domain-containing protein n=1 Tax=Tetrapyrgos nigripes TaxID=182062 RepID=A0A8H5LKX1_9AGAR|nr:hypothetical protein D9758_010296 [Tetrapyrgos nigripes]
MPESKIKCDLNYPCSKCSLRGRHCIYINDPKISRQKKLAAATKDEPRHKTIVGPQANSSEIPSTFMSVFPSKMENPFSHSPPPYQAPDAWTSCYIQSNYDSSFGRRRSVLPGLGPSTDTGVGNCGFLGSPSASSSSSDIWVSSDGGGAASSYNHETIVEFPSIVEASCFDQSDTSASLDPTQDGYAFIGYQHPDVIGDSTCLDQTEVSLMQPLVDSCTSEGEGSQFFALHPTCSRMVYGVEACSPQGVSPNFY